MPGDEESSDHDFAGPSAAPRFAVPPPVLFRCSRHLRYSWSRHSVFLRAELTTWSGLLSMNCAYSSSSTLTGSSMRNSRVRIAGAFLMMDMLVRLLDSTSEAQSGPVEKTAAPDEVPQGGSDPKNFLGGWKPKKWGRSRPSSCFFHRAFFLPASVNSLVSEKWPSHTVKGAEQCRVQCVVSTFFTGLPLRLRLKVRTV